ncbi:MAG: AAA family ATPase [Dorea sp.]|nr:AAA family ATPase [Dorea sp.]
MFRIYEEKIENWINESKKALLIYGARQVGKTYLVRKMLEKANISYFEVNFQEREDILQALKNLDTAEDLSMRLALYSKQTLVEGESVIFFDEIQLYPEIVTKIKFLVDEGKYRYILSGSNLGVELKGIKSIPVGYVEMFQMYPMNLFEFSRALGVTNTVFEHLEECFAECKPVDEVVHSRMINIFYYYLICGGMPSVVSTFIKSRNLRIVRTEQENIIRQYKADFVKYEADDKKLRIISIYDSIPSQLNQQNRRFIYTQLNKELKFERYENSFLWLKDAAVAIPVYIAEEPKSPLILSKSKNQFKLFMGDVGLLTSCYSDEVSEELLSLNPDQNINNGALFENFIAQELSAIEMNPYYYKSKRIGEIDFLIEWEGKVVPLEIKSGKGYKKHKALDNLMGTDEFKIEKGYVLSLENVEVTDSCIYVPIYFIGLFRKKQRKDIIINWDF